MFALKPKSTQNNPSATFYKRCFDLSKYYNAMRPYVVTYGDGTKKRFVYDKDKNQMIEISEPQNPNTSVDPIYITSNIPYGFFDKLIGFYNDRWVTTIYNNVFDIRLDTSYFYDNISALLSNNASNTTIIKSFITTITGLCNDYVTNVLELTNKTITDFVVELDGVSYSITHNTRNNGFYLCRLINNNVQFIIDNSTDATMNTLLPHTAFNGKQFSVKKMTIYYVDNNTNASETTNLTYADVKKYFSNFVDNFLGMFINQTIMATTFDKLKNDKISQQQRSYFIDSGNFDYCYIGDINNVEEQYIKGFNVEFTTFDIKTETDLPLNNDDIAIIDGVPYIISDVSYKTIRLPKPLRYTFCTLTELKR